MGSIDEEVSSDVLDTAEYENGNNFRESPRHDDIRREHQGEAEEQDRTNHVKATHNRILIRVRRVAEDKACIACFAVAVVFLVVALVAIVFVTRSVIAAGIHSDIVISNESADGFDQFQNHSVEADNFVEFYVFNITNPDDVLNGAKPKLEEIGPICYDFFLVRGDIQWDTAKDQLDYREHTYYTFNRERTLSKSRGKIDSDQLKIVTLNILFTGVRAAVGSLLWEEACWFLGWNSDYDRLFTERTVAELISGYEVEVTLLDGLINVPITFPGLLSNLSQSDDPNWKKKTTIIVGEENVKDVYNLVAWRGLSRLEILCPWTCSPFTNDAHLFPCCKSQHVVPVWGTDMIDSVWDSDANAILGRTGEQFSPDIAKESKFIVFNDIAWRSLLFENLNGDEVEFKGIKMLRFSPADSTFLNSTEHPPNSRYYLNGPRGIFANLSIVQSGAELYASLPHFLGGDPSLVDGVEGLKPNFDDHRMYFDVDPLTGQTMVERVRAQVNGRVWSGSSLGFDHWFPNVQDGTFVPIAWFAMLSEINDKTVDKFTQIYLLGNIRLAAILVCAILLVFCVAILLYALMLNMEKRRRENGGREFLVDPLIPSTQ